MIMRPIKSVNNMSTGPRVMEEDAVRCKPLLTTKCNEDLLLHDTNF